MKKFVKYLMIIILILVTLSPTLISAADDKDANSNWVYLGGEAFGIKMFSDGLFVTKTEGFKSDGEVVCPAKNAEIQINDVIISANDIKLTSSNEFKEIIENSMGETIGLKIKRDGKLLYAELCPIKDSEGNYRAGMWIKDSAAGLGTITFYSDEYEAFCGLGHGICEQDTNTLMPLSSGRAEGALVTSVTKSRQGKVGTLNGYFTDNQIGEVYDNNNQGVYGSAESIYLNKKVIEIAKRDEVEKGEAYIYTTTDSGYPKAYKIKITKIKNNDTDINMVIKIVDEELLDIAGGIVQGMSGSPIIQNGKLIGALTHVLVDNVDMGYAIFAETMYENMCNICATK